MGGYIHPLPPHSGGDILFFLANRIRVDCGGRELRMAHPFLDHMERYAIHRGIDPEPLI